MRADNKRPLTSRIGAYEIIRPLAKGGMAELFLVRVTGPEGFEKVVVLKRILPHFAENPRFVRAFLDEAKLVAGFDHPHIAHVHDMGRADASYFFTMEFVHGVDLRAVFRRSRRERSPLPLEHVVLVVKNIASALHYAHERRGPDGKPLGIVHRDVSPSNIIVSYEGAPKLIDFGIAKARSSSMKTQTGALKGKISYMSPEQAKGAAIDRRTDVFALGTVLWELIANRRLYTSDNEMATIQRIIHEPAGSPVEHRPDCPPALERIVARALALDVEERYPTAAALDQALEDFALEHRLKQSASLLGAELKERFALEIALWEQAMAGTVTVTDAIAIADDRTIRIRAAPSEADDPEDHEESSLDGAEVRRRTREDSNASPTIKVPVVGARASESVITAPVPVPEPVVVDPRGRGRTWIAIAGAAAAVIAVVIGLAIAVGTSGGVRTTGVAAPPAPIRPVPADESAPPLATSPEDEIDMSPEVVLPDGDAGGRDPVPRTDEANAEPRGAEAIAEPRLDPAKARPRVDAAKAKPQKPTGDEPKPRSRAEDARPKLDDPKPRARAEDPPPSLDEPKPKARAEDPKPKPPKPRYDPDAVFPPSGPSS